MLEINNSKGLSGSFKDIVPTSLEPLIYERNEIIIVIIVMETSENCLYQNMMGEKHLRLKKYSIISSDLLELAEYSKNLLIQFKKKIMKEVFQFSVVQFPW